ncbi:hypothetical protein FXO38_23818 [Capsicum annuum]|nr:hypothetical protein FXO37_28536 [Capsicum annuum]KAF3637216.1 hypothetical protein FXO38_23818 [Capsicum annuum]
MMLASQGNIVEEAQCAKENLQGKLFNDPRITIEYPSNSLEFDGDFLEYHPIPGRNVPSAPAAVCQENKSDEILWKGFIATRGVPVCQARIPKGESIERKIPDIINFTYKKGLDMLAYHYTDAAVGFNILSISPHTEEDFASYTESLKYLSSNNRALVAEFADGTTLFLVPPSDFLKKVLKVDSLTRIYGVILKYAHHTPSGTSLPPETNQPQYVKAP